MSANSFTAAPGDMSYDRDPRRINATCPQCGDDFYKGRDDDGALCDRCCDERDFFAAEDQHQPVKTPAA